MAQKIMLRRKVPSYFQSPKDNSCGPQVIRMVADFYKHERGRNLIGEEWHQVLQTTMNGNIERSIGTAKKDLKKALNDLGLGAKALQGGDPKRLAAIEMALRQEHPVIVSCRMPYRGKLVDHYAVLAGMAEEYFYLRDPFPHGGKKSKVYRLVSREEFMKKKLGSGKRETVWGRLRWGIEVFPKKSVS